jgi:hypothetical protein
MLILVIRALPILRQLGAQSTTDVLRGGVDFSMLKVWAGLEARSWLQASIEDVSDVVIAMKVTNSWPRWNDVSNTTSSPPMYDTRIMYK